MDTIIISKCKISRDFNGGDAVHYGISEAGVRFARFRVGSKRYDRSAPNNTRWQNYSVVAYDRVAAKLEKLSPVDGSVISLVGEFSIENWVDKLGVVHETPSIMLHSFEVLNCSKQSEEKESGNPDASAKHGVPASSRDNFTGYENIESAGFFDDDYEEI